MKISELIARLTELQAEHGDLPVTAMIGNYGDGLAEFDEITVQEPDQDWPLGCFWLE